MKEETGILNHIKGNFKKELQDCIANNFNPCCHVASWNHFKDRIIRDFERRLRVSGGNCQQQIQVQVDNMLGEIKITVEQWQEYYKQHNEDGCYDSWLERFWIEEKPDEETEERYYMARMYEKFVKEGIIEIYYYTDSSNEIDQKFLNKWYQKYNCPYTEEEDEYLYIGQKEMLGNFYFGYGDFYEPIDSPRKSAWWNLVSHVLEQNKQMFLNKL